MAPKSLIVGFAILLFALTQGESAWAATITRNPSTPTTPNAADFPATYNNHPFQVGYAANTTVNSGDNHMFRDTIPIVCARGQRVTGAGLTFVLVKIRNGSDAGDNDSLNFWLNGQKKYELNVGAAATPGLPATISIDLGALPPIGTGPNTVTATYSSLPNLSMIPDIQASQRLSIGIQDDTDIHFATVNYTCEDDPNAGPVEPIPVDPCCPPWNQAIFASSVKYVGSGSFNGPYTLKVDPSFAVLNALHAYVNYIHSTNSALTSLQISFQLYDHTGLPVGNNGTPIGPVSGMSVTANSTVVQLHTNYNTNTPAIFAGVSTPGTSTTPSSYPMQVGKEYLFHSGMWTDSADFFDKPRCQDVDVYMRILFFPIHGKRGGQRAVLELRDAARARTITIPLDGSRAELPVKPPRR